MNLIPWRNKHQNGNGSIMELRTEMDRMIESLFGGPFSSMAGTSGGSWVPTVDIAENDRDVIVRTEVPGVDPKDLEITVAGNRLEIAGEKKFSRQHEERDCQIMESQYGSFRRIVDLPTDVDSNQVTAEHAHGVVTIKLAKAISTVSKRIPVKTT